jgi:Skp family chaperone for outer membrane proteins
MKFKALLLAAILVAIGITSTSAQQKTNVCIIDLAEVFKNHAAFNAELTKLQTEAEAFKATIENQRQQLTARREAMLGMPPGSDQYVKEESALAQITAGLQVNAKNQISEFAKREAQLHFNTYQQIQQLIANYCKQRRISIVLVFSGAKVDPGDPDSIMRKVNGDIVYNAPEKDITQSIIQYLTQVSANPNTNTDTNKK